MALLFLGLSRGDEHRFGIFATYVSSESARLPSLSPDPDLHVSSHFL